MRIWLCVVWLIFAVGAAQAVELQLPASARQVMSRDTSQDQYTAPTGPFAEGHVPGTLIEGSVARSAWRIDVAGLTPLQLIAPLRRQLVDAGFEIVLDCAAHACGGYDFRFGTEVLPAPSMYVNIRNFHVLTALQTGGNAPDVAVSVMASASSGASYVQIMQAGSTQITTDIRTSAVTPQPNIAPVPAAPSGPMETLLARDGHVVLDGLRFESGTSDLGVGPFEVLRTLADTLRANPDVTIALVGHTDNVGSLDGNIALSRNRARAVRERLIGRYDIPAARVEAEGMGYLAPHTSNLTAQGREANRRVEAVVLAR